MVRQNKHRNFDMTVLLIFAVFAIVMLAMIYTFTNKSIIDTTYSFEQAIISMPNGEVVRGKVSNWTDFDDGDQLQICIDGKTYLTHASNVVLISK